MTEQNDKERDKQTETTPGGLEVRTPTRDEFFGNLRRVSRPEPGPDDDSAASRSDG